MWLVLNPKSACAEVSSCHLLLDSWEPPLHMCSWWGHPGPEWDLCTIGAPFLSEVSAHFQALVTNSPGRLSESFGLSSRQPRQHLGDCALGQNCTNQVSPSVVPSF